MNQRVQFGKPSSVELKLFQTANILYLAWFGIGILEISRESGAAQNVAVCSFHSHMLGIFNHSPSIQLVSQADLHLL